MLFAMTSCNDCERKACEDVAKPAAAAIAQGVAGVVSYQSDVVENGCAECTYSEADFAIWATDSLVSSAEEAVSVHASDADIMLHASRRYEQSLEPGNYLVCVDGSVSTYCAAIAVGSNETWTVHLATTYGPGRMIVFAPGSQTPNTSAVFDISTNDR